MPRRSVPGEQASLVPAETRTCPKCAGDGFLGFMVCRCCGGTGKVTILPRLEPTDRFSWTCSGCGQSGGESDLLCACLEGV